MRPRPNPDEGMRQILASTTGHSGRCDICGHMWPEKTMRMQSGLYVSTMCHYEEGGGKVERDQQRADASALGAELAAKEVEPSRRPPGFDFTTASNGYVTGISGISPRPVPLTAGGASVAVTLTGTGLVSGSVTLDWGDAAITGAITYTSDTQLDIPLAAGIGVANGDYDLTLTDSGGYKQLFRKVVQVR